MCVISLIQSIFSWKIMTSKYHQFFLMKFKKLNKNVIW